MAQDNVVDLREAIQKHLLNNFPNIDTKRPQNDPTLVIPTPFVPRDPKTIPRREFLFGKHYIRKFVSSTIAPGGLGKSSLVLTEAISMATGRKLLNATPKKRAKVWYWNGEDPFDEIERRIYGILIRYEIDPQELVGWFFVDSGRDSPMRVAEETVNGALIVQPVFDEMETYIKYHGIDLLIVDPFVSSHSVSENDNSIINDVVKGFARLADRCNGAVELVHHVKKARDSVETQAEDARGASALVDACRSVRTLTRMPEDTGREFGFDNRRRKSFFYMALGKANLGPPADPRWFELVSQEIGNEGDRDLREYSDDVGVVVTWEPPAAFSGVSNHDVERIQAEIAKIDCKADRQAEMYVGHVIASCLGFSLKDPGNKKRVEKIIETWLKGGLLVEVEEMDYEQRKMKRFIRVGKPFDMQATG